MVSRARLGDRDADRNTLHDFGEVAGRVVRWEKREFRSGSSAHACDLSFADASTVCVDLELHGLTWADLGELGLLEVGSHPHARVRYDAHERLAGLDQLSDFYLLSRHFSRRRRGDQSVIELESRVLSGRAGREGASIRDAHACFRGVDSSTGRRCLTLGRQEIRVRHCRRGLRGVQLLLRDDLLVGELASAGQIEIGFVGVGARGANLCVESSSLSGGALNLRLRLPGEPTTAAGCFGCRQIRLRLLEPDPIIGPRRRGRSR